MKWQQLSACTQCGSPYVVPDIKDYDSFIPLPVKKTCGCLNGPVKNILDALGVGAQVANLIAQWKKKGV